MSIEAFCRSASTGELVYHRLAPLAFACADRHTRAALRPYVAASAARDLGMRRALTEIAEVAELADLPMLVFKGAATGVTLYHDGALRPREDIDVWVDGWAQAEALTELLVAAGYRRTHQLPGTEARHAIALMRRPFEMVDVHAVCARRQRIAHALEFGRVWEHRQPFEVDGSTLFTPCDTHTFLLGATHLSGHHAGQLAPLILVEDLRRTAVRLGREQWRDVWALACAFGLLSALGHATDLLEQWSPNTVPRGLRDALRDCVDESARFDDPMLAVLDDLDLLDAADAAAYLGELIYPPSEYLEQHFGIARSRPRPLLAGWRLIRAVVARLAAGGHNLGA